MDEFALSTLAGVTLFPVPDFPIRISEADPSVIAVSFCAPCRSRLLPLLPAIGRQHPASDPSRDITSDDSIVSESERRISAMRR